MDNPPQQEPLPQNIIEPIAQLQSINSLRSADSMAQLKEVKQQEQDNQELQVVQSKVDKRINHEEIMRMFNEQLEREERERAQIERRRMEMRNKSKDAPKQNNKRSIIQEKKANKEQALQQALSQKSARIRKIIQSSCRKYHTMHRPSMYDTKLMRYRFECKQKLFINLCFGIQQLRQLSANQLSEIERQILTQNPYYVVKRLATTIDAEMVKVLNKGDRNQVSRQYKSQWETLINNIKDQTNFQLKRKILSRILDPQKIALANQIDFFTQAKREEILEKQKRFVAQFTVQKAILPVRDEENEEIMDKPPVEIEVPRQQIPLKTYRSGSVNKYIQESSIAQLQELLSENQLNKMLSRLQEDLQGKSQTLLIRNFKETFKL